MTTDTLYYGGVIPEGHLATWYGEIVAWEDDNLDGQLARTVCHTTDLDETIEEYEITKIDFTGNDVVPQGRKAPGQEVSIAGSGSVAKIWRWSDYFTYNGADTQKSPKLYSQYVRGCMAKIFRGEDKIFYNGRTVNNITGLKTAAEANTNGKVAASGGDYNNAGAWLSSDTNRDIYEDLRVARSLLDSRYRSNLTNLYLVGNSESLDAIWQKDPYSDSSNTIAQSVAPLFGRTANDKIGSWAIVNDQIDDNYVFIVTKNSEAAELLQAKSVTVDDNYPRKPIDNYQVHLYQDVGIVFHDNNAFVEVAIN